MPVTIKDIAKTAGVSHTTVSRALNGHPAISAATTARIQKLAAQMGYIPSAVAQSLLSQRTYTIGVVVTTLADPFITRVIEGIEKTAQKADYSVFLTTSHNHPDRELKILQTLHRRRVDAIIVSASRLGSLYVSELRQIQVPIVLVNHQEAGDDIHTVAVDDGQGAWLAVEHLLALGHRHIGYVAVTNRLKSNRRRLRGYQLALEQAGIVPQPAWVIASGSSLKNETEHETEGDDFKRGRAALEPLRAAGVTAVFCYNDLTAIGLLSACRDHNIAIPDRLSIIGFDNIEPTLYVTPPLSTICQSRSLLGQLAMELVLDLLAGKPVQDRTISCELIVRGSTGLWG